MRKAILLVKELPHPASPYKGEERKTDKTFERCSRPGHTHFWCAPEFLETRARFGMIFPELKLGASQTMKWDVRKADALCSTLKIGLLLLLASGWISCSGSGEVEMAGSAPPAAAAEREHPNVLLVSIDSLRADHLHCYGYPRKTSPNIDLLAAEGVVFETCVAPTSWTLPSHITLLTGLPPVKHGINHSRAALSPDAVLLAEVFQDAGYATAGFVSGPLLDGSYGFAQGFDHYDDYTIVRRNAKSHAMVTSPQLRRITTEWLARWDQDGRKQPFFIFLHMWDVHYDYRPPGPYNRMFDPDYQGTITSWNFMRNRRIHPDMDREDLRHIIALYDGEIRFTDMHLGRLLDKLMALGEFDNTIIAVTSDHGDEFFEHGNKGHFKTLYEESLLVPLVLRYPKKVPGGKVIKPIARLMDVAPTLLSLAEIEIPPQFGMAEPKANHADQDLTPLFAEGASAAALERYAFSELHRELENIEAIEDVFVPNRDYASVRTARHKLVKNLMEPDQLELYDLLVDPGERVNLVDENRSLSIQLEKELDLWRATLQSTGNLALQIDLSEEHIEQIRSLGYFE